MHRLAAYSTVMLLAAGMLGAQQPFVAPGETNVIGSAEAASTRSPAHALFVANSSSLPIVVYELSLRECENVEQPCDHIPANVVIPARGRAAVGRVSAKTRNKRFTYQWTFAYRPDTSMPGVLATMREHGLIGQASEPAVNLATGAATDSALPSSMRGDASHEPITAEDRKTKIIALDANNRPIALSERYRFKVAYGSILGSTKMPGAPLQVTGPCINPAELARYEADTTISSQPAHPPTLGTGFALPTLPPELRDSTLRTGKALVRWAVDTTGDAVPGSVSVLESPHGLISVKVCGAIIGSHVTPATDEKRKPIRTWVQLPIVFTN